MTVEHPFAQYIRILGKGKHGARSLSQDEARTALGMILDGAVADCQLGAFLMLLRVKEESPEELAGFVQAVQQRVTTSNHVSVDLDWSSYAGKRRHLPWFIFSAQLLAQNKIRVFMHGADGHTAGRLYTQDILSNTLGLPIASNFLEAGAHLQQSNFAYMPLQALSPKLHEIMELRPLLGLRSPVHTIARMMNPLHASHAIHGIFHPSYRDTHQVASQLIGQTHMAVLKGEGGEIERNPDQACLVKSLHQGQLSEEEWPAMFGNRHIKDITMNPQRMLEVWRGQEEDEYAIAAITGTLAIALKLLQQADSQTQAQAMAQRFWQNRDKARF